MSDTDEHSSSASGDWLCGIFEMIGAGAAEFAGVDPDEYVRQIREAWD